MPNRASHRRHSKNARRSRSRKMSPQDRPNTFRERSGLSFKAFCRDGPTFPKKRAVSLRHPAFPYAFSCPETKSGTACCGAIRMNFFPFLRAGFPLRLRLDPPSPSRTVLRLKWACRSGRERNGDAGRALTVRRAAAPFPRGVGAPVVTLHSESCPFNAQRSPFPVDKRGGAFAMASDACLARIRLHWGPVCRDESDVFPKTDEHPLGL